MKQLVSPYLLPIFLLCISSIPMQAQRKNTKKGTVTTSPSIDELMKTYRFEEAIDQLQNDIAAKQRKRQSTETEERLLEQATLGSSMLPGTEKVIFIDSIVVDKNKFLNAIRIDEENGSIDLYKNLFPSQSASISQANSTVFMPSLKDKVIYSTPIKQGSEYMRLCMRDKLDNEWGKEIPLPGLSGAEDMRYPYMLSDGITLYYSATGSESLGGYDIFVTRYSSDDGNFVRPENIGMPFNSPANDYLYIIDEVNNLGWFASDRNQPEGSICIYVFIPNATRTPYNPDLMEEDQLGKRARIHSIKADWEECKEQVKGGLERLKNVFSQTKQDERPRDFTLVINDEQTYYDLSDFRNAKARQMAGQWLNARTLLIERQNELQRNRNLYGEKSKTNKQTLAQTIRNQEQEVEKMEQSVRQMEKTIRQYELNPR